MSRLMLRTSKACKLAARTSKDCRVHVYDRGKARHIDVSCIFVFFMHFKRTSNRMSARTSKCVSKRTSTFQADV